MKRPLKYALTVGLGVLLLEAALVLPASQWAEQLVQWIHEAGAAGVVVYAGAYVAATLLLLPGSLLTAGAGLAYGPVLGTLLVSPLSVIASTLAFLLGRTFARDWVAKRIERDARFAVIDGAIGQHGFKIVTLLRLSPVVPFNVLNYALGLTRVGLRDFVLGSFVGMLPGTFLYVYLGSLVTAVSGLGADRGSASTAQQGLYWAGLAATIVATVVITRIARQALTHAVRRKDEPLVADESGHDRRCTSVPTRRAGRRVQSRAGKARASICCSGSGDSNGWTREMDAWHKA